MTTSDHPFPRIYLQEFQEYYRNPENAKHIREGQCTKIYWHMKLYTTEHPPLGSSPETLGSSPEMVYDKHKRQYELLITWSLNPSTSFTLRLRLPYTPPQLQRIKSGAWFSQSWNFLPDPGVSGVQSMGPGLSNYLHPRTLLRLCWCDSGWWWYQLNTS